MDTARKEGSWAPSLRMTSVCPGGVPSKCTAKLIVQFRSVALLIGNPGFTKSSELTGALYDVGLRIETEWKAHLFKHCISSSYGHPCTTGVGFKDTETFVALYSASQH